MDLPIYFISDIHLMLNRTKQEAKREEILFSFFDHVRNSGLYKSENVASCLEYRNNVYDAVEISIME